MMFCWLSMLKSNLFWSRLKLCKLFEWLNENLKFRPLCVSSHHLRLLNDSYCISFHAITLSETEMNLSFAFLPQTEADEILIFQIGSI